MRNHQELKEEAVAEKILSHPKFQQMSRQKSVFGWSFSFIIFVMYVAFIWVIGTNPELFATKVNPDGVTTWGIYVGIFVIIFSFVITAIYVYFANGKFEKITQDVVKEVMGAEDEK
ncbi:DUF485 domain-containing protein [Pelistega ratti]|uniref:DUF485 domain-containing protein n=1 Tax=Pelistega ratti TaxID=2652177 RepID=UPI001358C8DF|nr:DUF485 domain-containing protein [Pelistega ratti]